MADALQDARKGAVSGVATTAAGLLTGGRSRVTKAVAVGAASAAASKAQGGSAFDAGVAGGVSGAIELATGHAEISNNLTLGLKGPIGEILKSTIKKIAGSLVKEPVKFECKKLNGDQKC